MLPEGGGPAPCRWHRRSGGRVTVAWPPVYRAWARDAGRLAAGRGFVRTAAALEPSGTRPATPRGLAIESPPREAVYLIDPTLRAEFQALRLRALSSDGPRAGRLIWRVDGRVVGSCAAEAALSWPLRPGRHTIRVSDSQGAFDETTIRVK